MNFYTVFTLTSPLIALACYIAASAFAEYRAARRAEESNRRNGLYR